MSQSILLEKIQLIPLEQQYVREDDAAAFCGLTRATFRNMRDQHCGPPYSRLSQRSVIYSIADLKAWIESAKIRPGFDAFSLFEGTKESA